jgi:hypothetical protein
VGETSWLIGLSKSGNARPLNCVRSLKTLRCTTRHLNVSERRVLARQRQDVAELKAEVAAGREEKWKLDQMREVHRIIRPLFEYDDEIGPIAGSA